MNRATTLPNGFRIHTRTTPGLLSAYQLIVPFGGDTLSYQETETGRIVQLQPGSAHFFEHVLHNMAPNGLPEGAERTPTISPPGIRNGLTLLDQNKAVFVNAYTWHDITNYYFVTRENALENLAHLLEYVHHLYLPHDRFAQEVGTISDEIGRDENDADSVHSEAWKRQLYRTHGTKHPILGTKDSIRGIALEDVLSLHATFYRPSNAILCGYGNVDHDVTVAVAQAFFERIGAARYAPQPQSPAQDEPEAVVHASNIDDPLRRDDIARPKLLMGWKHVLDPTTMSIEQIVDFHVTTRIATELLGGVGTASRERLIDAGIDARTFSCLTVPFRDHSEIEIKVDADHPRTAVTAVQAAAQQLATHGPDAGEFPYVIASMRLDDDLGQDRYLALGMALARCAVVTNDPDNYDRVLDRLATITQEEVIDRLPDIFAPHKFAATLMVPTDWKG